MADFNFYLNRQGVRGNKGEKGDTGFAPIVEVDTNTAAEYKLKIITEAGELITDNLRGSAVEDLGGTYMRYDPTTQAMFAAPADRATSTQYGEVRLASADDIIALSDVTPITPEGIVDNYAALIKSSDNSIIITQDQQDYKINLRADVSGIEGDISGLEARVSGCEQQIGDNVQDIQELQINKVSKELGKGLSTNDFTDSYKEKVDSALQPTSVDGTTITYDNITGKISSNIDTSNFVSLNTNQTITGEKLFAADTLKTGSSSTGYGTVATFDNNLYEMADDSSTSRQAGVVLGGSRATLRAGTGMFIGILGESGGVPTFTMKIADIYNTYNLTGGTNVSIIKNPSTGLYEIVAHDTTYSQGNGISIDNANQISVKVDGSTVDFNQSGELEVVGGGSITVDQTYDPTSVNAQSGVAIANAGFLTGITSSNVISALGYTPYDSSNPNGYITSAALTNYVTTNTTQTITGNKVINGASLTTNDVIVLDGSNSRIVGTVSNNTRGIIRLTSGDEVEIGDTSSTVNIKGSATRPTYNGADLALLSDAGGSAPSNMVTTDTQQTISGNKTFSGRLRKSFGMDEIEIGTNAGYKSIIFSSGSGNVPWHITSSGYTGATLTIDGFYTTTIQAGNTSGYSYLTLAEDSLVFHKSDNTTVDLLSGGGSAPSNMVTTDTRQTISGHKIFSDYSTEIAGDLHVTKNGTSRIYMGDAYVLTVDDVNDIFTVGDTGKYLKIKAYDTVVISNHRDNELTIGYDTLTYKKSDDSVVNLLAGGGTVDQTYDGTSTNAQSGVAIEGKLANYQTTSNLVTSISSSSTNTQYPSAKCVYDIVGNIESLLHNINSGS